MSVQLHSVARDEKAACGHTHTHSNSMVNLMLQITSIQLLVLQTDVNQMPNTTEVIIFD